MVYKIYGFVYLISMFQRPITAAIKTRLEEKRRHIQVMVGPRQAGKTTAIMQVLQGGRTPYHYAAADLPAPPPAEWITRQWEIARLKLQKNSPAVLILKGTERKPRRSIRNHPFPALVVERVPGLLRLDLGALLVFRRIPGRRGLERR